LTLYAVTNPPSAVDPLAVEGTVDVDIYTIIFLALAVFIFLRLRSVLGQRTGRERPPYDPYSARDAVRTPTSDKVVALPVRGAEQAPQPAEPAEPADPWKGIAEAGSPTAAGLDAVVAEDPSFDVKHFLAGARAAYEMIVTAFAEGDRRSLKNLLRVDRQGGHRRRRGARQDGADHRAVRLAAGVGHARSYRRRDRRVPRQGD
jgi:predicted lipid-binding transport protein (Tim44 family)